MCTDGIYQGMLETAQQWSQICKDIENEEIPDTEKMRMLQEFFRLEEGEVVIFPGVIYPEPETGKKKKRTTSTIPNEEVKS